MRYTKPITGLFFGMMLAVSGIAGAHDVVDGKGAHVHGHFVRVDGSFDQADSNGDGKISRQEWRAEAARVFSALDRDEDGHVDQNEYRDLPRALP